MASDSDPPASSLSGLYSTLVPVLIVALVYVGIFLCLRRSNRRWYAPRTYLGSLREEYAYSPYVYMISANHYRERTTALPGGFFNWIGPFWKIPDTYALQHQSLDAYLFLRFLRMTVVIMFVGACITFPV